jgi:hypothetical protein
MNSNKVREVAAEAATQNIPLKDYASDLEREENKIERRKFVNGFIRGAVWREKDLMEKAEKFLRESYDAYDYFNEEKQEYVFNIDRLINDFRKITEE